MMTSGGSMNLLLFLLEHYHRAPNPALYWRITLAAKSLLGKVILQMPVDEFSAQLGRLRDSIGVGK